MRLMDRTINMVIIFGKRGYKYYSRAFGDNRLVLSG